jgi:hypothetical protein
VQLAKELLTFGVAVAVLVILEVTIAMHIVDIIPEGISKSLRRTMDKLLTR